MKHLLKEINEKWYYMIADMFSKASIYFLSLVFSYLVQPKDYGYLSLYNSLFTIFFVFVSLNLTNNYITKKRLDNSKDFSEILSSVLAFTFILNIFFLIISGVILGFKINIYSISSILLFCGLTSAILNCNYDIYQNLLVADRKKNKYLINSIAFSTLLIIFSILIFIIYPKVSIYGIIISRIALLLLFSLYSFFYLKKEYNLKLKINYKIIKDALKFSFPLIMHSLGGFILNYIDKFMLNDMKNITTTAIYSFSYNMASVMMVISLALNKSILPKFFELKKQRKENKLEIIISNDLKTILVLYILFINAVGIIYPLFPDAYNNYFLIFLMLAFNYVVFYGYNIYSDYLYYHEKTIKIFTNTLMSGIINLLLNSILIPKFSSTGAAISTLISYIALFIFYYFSVRKIEKNYYPAKKLVIAFVIALIYSAFYYLIYNIKMLKIINIALMILIVIGYLVIKRGKNERDIRGIFKI